MNSEAAIISYGSILYLPSSTTHIYSFSCCLCFDCAFNGIVYFCDFILYVRDHLSFSSKFIELAVCSRCGFSKPSWRPIVLLKGFSGSYVMLSICLISLFLFFVFLSAVLVFDNLCPCRYSINKIKPVFFTFLAARSQHIFLKLSSAYIFCLFSCYLCCAKSKRVRAITVRIGLHASDIYGLNHLLNSILNYINKLKL